jgi:drug/metabolite transporter (DMT)-like permease
VSPRFLFALQNYRAALIAAFFFGLIAPGTKYFSQSIPPQSLAGILYFFAGLGLFLIILLRNEIRGAVKQIQIKDQKWFLTAIIFGGILGPAFLTYGLINISGSTASLLLNLESVLTSLIAWFIFKEHFEKKIVFGMFFIIAGCLILSFRLQDGGGQDTITGFIFITLACLSWSIDNNVTRNISHLNPIFISSIKGLIAGSSNLFFGYLIGEKLNFNYNLLQAGLLGFLGIGISLVAFITSLSKIGTARTGALFSTAPFIGSILSLLILNEEVSTPFLIALTLMACGIWLHLSEDHSHNHTHLEIEHSHIHIHDLHHQHTHNSNDPKGEPHLHTHVHNQITHEHPHFPDSHHEHSH